jgi:hypothetical protein
MKTICSWCKAVIRDDPTASNGPISHGLCSSCAERLFAEMGTPLEQYLDQWKEPILILDNHGRVRGGNQAAKKLPGFAVSPDTALLPGDVIECPYAELPEGCGKTVHCVGCAIRRAITEAQKTGHPVQRLPAHRECRIGDTPATLWVSAEKLGPHLYLILEPIPTA